MFLLMLQYVIRAFAINRNNPWLHECLIKFSKSGKYKKGNIYVKVIMTVCLSSIKLDMKEISTKKKVCKVLK